MIHNNKDENDLIARLKEGHHSAASQMAEIHSPALLKSAFLLCNHQTDAHDLVQDTFIQALKSIHRFKGQSKLFTWLYGILFNLNRQRIRKQKWLSFPGTLPEKKIDHREKLEKQMDMQTVSVSLTALMNKLSPKHKEVLIMRFFDDMKLNEMAETLNVSTGTVKSRLHYAVNYLKKKFPHNLNLFHSRVTN